MKARNPAAHRPERSWVHFLKLNATGTTECTANPMSAWPMWARCRPLMPRLNRDASRTYVHSYMLGIYPTDLGQ